MLSDFSLIVQPGVSYGHDMTFSERRPGSALSSNWCPLSPQINRLSREATLARKVGVLALMTFPPNGSALPYGVGRNASEMPTERRQLSQPHVCPFNFS